MTTTTKEQDVVDLLLSQHKEVRALFRRVKTANGESKRQAFQELVRLLAVHESAEELLVHPAARQHAGNGVVQARLQEEDEAKHVLSELYGMDPASAEFDARFSSFEQAVVAHATHEEKEEFPELRRHTDPERLRGMAGAVRAAEAVAPTRPHPTAGESATANLIAGPPAALFDRMRDAVRDWRQSHNS